jgi:hypothetical protein
MQAAPFSILVAGGFGGRSGGPGWEQRPTAARPLEVDRDDLDAAFRSLAPEVRLDLPFCRSVAPRRFADLHPDGLVERLPALDLLLEARQSVADPARVRRLLARAGSDPGELEPEAGPAEPASRSLDDAGILEDILTGAPDAPRPHRRASPTGDPDFDRMLHEILESSSDGTDFRAQDRWREAIDAELAARVRAIVRHASFRVLEASWTALRRLVQQAETGESLRIQLLDLSQADLATQVEAADKLDGTALFRWVADPPAGSAAPDLLLTDYRLTPEEADAPVLDALCELAERTGVTVLAAADGGALRPEEASPAALSRWRERRSRAGASRVGLCAPRLLLRSPYAPDSNPVERFAFDEGARVEDAASYLWGSGAFAVADAVVRALARDGDLSRLEAHLQLENLPIHVYREAGEVRYQGPTEQELSESEARRWIEAGVIPVTAVRGRDSARVLSLRSFAGPALFGV